MKATRFIALGRLTTWAHASRVQSERETYEMAVDRYADVRADVKWDTQLGREWREYPVATVRALLADADALAKAKDVLAVVHRDGGHHTAEVGFDQSCLDAAVEVAEMRAEITTLRNAAVTADERAGRERERAERLRAALVYVRDRMPANREADDLYEAADAAIDAALAKEY